MRTSNINERYSLAYLVGIGKEATLHTPRPPALLHA